MASNYSATSLSAGLNTFLHLENANGDTRPTAHEPSIDTLSTYCAAAILALFQARECNRVREGGGARDLVSQLASIGLELSINWSGLNLEIKVCPIISRVFPPPAMSV